MNCSDCLIRCRAGCCGMVPLPPDLFRKHPAQREVVEEIPFKGAVIARTKDNYCPFLTKDFKCSIYEDRPWICKKFGDETAPLMTCCYQDKDGRIRSRQERRQLERKINKILDKKLK